MTLAQILLLAKVDARQFEPPPPEMGTIDDLIAMSKLRHGGAR